MVEFSRWNYCQYTDSLISKTCSAERSILEACLDRLPESTPDISFHTLSLPHTRSIAFVNRKCDLSVSESKNGKTWPNLRSSGQPCKQPPRLET